MNNMRELSRRQWTGSDNREDIALGCTLRMADAAEKMAAATEKMAIHHDKLIRERDWYKEQYHLQRSALQSANRSNTSLRGHITKLRRKINNLQLPAPEEGK